MARLLARKVTPQLDDDDLAEVAGIVENRLGRRELALAVRGALQHLEPARGLLALPLYRWAAIYSTNFDRLVEKSYQLAHVDLNVVRSDFEYTNAAQSGPTTTLFKIHGCISQDIGFGDRPRMVLTERDYDEVARYRNVLFTSLRLHMMSGTTLIVGQSLRDAHLRDLAKEVGNLREEGVPGRVFLLVFDYDEDRARLLEQRGVEVVAGSLENLMAELQGTRPAPAVTVVHTAESADTLPPSLVATTEAVAHAVGLRPNPTRLFNGGSATYADIQNGFTIERQQERRLLDAQNGARGFFLVLSGAAGVGKTSLARRLLHRRHTENFACWEHSNDYPLDVPAWLGMEAQLRSANRQGMLLIDDCARHLATVNKLVDALGAIDRPFLRVVITVNASQWATRTKSPYFFRRGSLERLSLLTDADIRALVNLVDRQADIRSLVEGGFLRLGYRDKVQRLRGRCNSEMFVCLKNIFQTEQLDMILLHEYADLDDDAADVYRYVCAVQAMGGRVHRQLIIRLLGVDANSLDALLVRLEGVVREYDIDANRGLYGWTARHDVIADIIAKVKFSDDGEIYSLFERLIDGLNPTEYLELETARALAAEDMRIARLPDGDQRAVLLRRLISSVPAERTPRRRLIKLYLDENRLEDADREIRLAKETIGADDVISRYRAMLIHQRAETVARLRHEDRLAMLIEAARVVRQCVAKSPNDRQNYRVMADIGRTLAERYDKPAVLDEVIDTMRAREADVADPDFARDRRGLERTRRGIQMTS